jgi:hypothetical protein
MHANLRSLWVLVAVTLASCGTDGHYDYCYEGATDRDRASVSYNLNGEAVSGIMEAHYFEREPMSGRLKGFLRNDTLYGEFIYPEEGNTVYRQVIFMASADGLVEGFGEWVEVDGKIVYGNADELAFDHPLVLAPTRCR